MALFPLALTIEDEELFGLSMLVSVGLVFFINLVVMVTLSIKGLKRKLYLKGLKKKAEQRKKEAAEARQQVEDEKRVKQIKKALSHNNQSNTR